MGPPVRGTPHMEWGNVLATGFHAGGKSSVRGHTTEPSGYSCQVSHGCHREHISLHPGFQKHFCKSEVAFTHRLANPTPMGLHTRTEQGLDLLDVTEPQSQGEVGGRLTAFSVQSVKLSPPRIGAGSTGSRQPIGCPAGPIECCCGQILSAAYTAFSCDHVSIFAEWR